MWKYNITTTKQYFKKEKKNFVVFLEVLGFELRALHYHLSYSPVFYCGILFLPLIFLLRNICCTGGFIVTIPNKLLLYIG
jgi:hypothetical protein